MLLAGRNRVDTSKRRPRNGLSCSTPVCLVAGGSSPLRHLFHRPACVLLHALYFPRLGHGAALVRHASNDPEDARPRRKYQSRCPACVDGAGPDPARLGAALQRATPAASPETAARAHTPRQPAPITLIAPLRESSAAAQRGSRVGRQRRSPRAYNLASQRFACQSPDGVSQRRLQENVDPS